MRKPLDIPQLVRVAIRGMREEIRFSCSESRRVRFFVLFLSLPVPQRSWKRLYRQRLNSPNARSAEGDVGIARGTGLLDLRGHSVRLGLTPIEGKSLSTCWNPSLSNWFGKLKAQEDHLGCSNNLMLPVGRSAGRPKRFRTNVELAINNFE